MALERLTHKVNLLPYQKNPHSFGHVLRKGKTEKCCNNRRLGGEARHGKTKRIDNDEFRVLWHGGIYGSQMINCTHDRRLNGHDKQYHIAWTILRRMVMGFGTLSCNVAVNGVLLRKEKIIMTTVQ